MSEVKWIKITTNMFEDEKIDFIESLPECDAILIIWIKLLAQAGKTNSNGFIFLTEQIPYTDEMLSHKFRRPLNTVKLALQTLKQLEMITFNEEGYLKISNWEKHQNIEGLDKIREQNRIRQERYREKQKQLYSNVTVTLCNGTDIDIEEERDIEGEEEIEEESTTTTLSKNHFEYIKNTWNKLNEPITNIMTLNSGTNRHNMTKARIAEYGIDTVVNAIKSINDSEFLKGNNDRGWIITYDWFIKPNNFLKVAEGNYQDHNQNSKTNEYHNLLDNWASGGE